MINRRDFLKLGGAMLAGGLASVKSMPAQADSVEAASTLYQGKNMAGWLLGHGDAEYNASGEPPVDDNDIQTIHQLTYSEVRANIKRRVIKAHNITFKRITNPDALKYIHTCTFSFRLPYLPQMDTSATLNGQTIESGIFIWDGPKTRYDYGMAFQWIINPWGDGGLPSGTLGIWNGNKWIRIGKMVVDTNWHTAKMVVDFKRKTTLLLLDNKYQLSRFSKTAKDSSWGGTVDARFQGEAVSIDPRPDDLMKAIHKVQYKNWKWLWELA